MKQLFIIRHAKSDQSFFGKDFERPLNERGRTDAPVMAKRLADKNYTIDALVSSPAVRAKKTAELFADTLKIPTSEIIFISALYHASAGVFYDVVNGLPNELNRVALFSHNPGISNFVNSLVAGIRVDNMPTCAVFAVSCEINQWSDFKKATKAFLFFDYPKNTI